MHIIDQDQSFKGDRMKKKVAVFFGGVSCEHDVSIITGMQVVLSLAKSQEFEIVPIYIDQKGEFLTDSCLFDVSKIKDFKELSRKFRKLTFRAGDNHLYEIKGKKFIKIAEISCAVLCTHGEGGEDGSLQGLLKLSKIPQTSGGILSQSIGMDKEISKNIAKSIGVDVLDFEKFSQSEKLEEILLELDQKADYPYVVKPNSLGSSIGVKFCSDMAELEEALFVAFSFSREVLVEKAAIDFYELNISAVRIDGVIHLSEIEKPKQWHEILTFEDKYISKGKIKGMENLRREFPAEISLEEKQKIEEISLKLYEKFKLSGIVRFDYMSENKKIYFNEVNTIPGSLSSYLWRGKFKFNELLHQVIVDSINEYKKETDREFTFLSNIF